MRNKGVILLVEDNEKLNAANGRALKLRGYEVHAALNLKQARILLSRTEPDVILLDVMLPDGDGFDFCAEIRDSVEAHILFLSGRAEHADRVRGLDAGGDDYIIKPFHPEELMARIEAVIRRRNKSKAPARLLARGGLTLDIIAGQAFVAGANMDLSPKEFALLLLLAQNEGQSISADYIYEAVWKAPAIGHKNAVKTAVSRLRSKLDATDLDIVATRGSDAGYLLTVDEF